MTSPASLYTICYGAETAFGETTTTATTLQLQLADAADTSGLVHNMIDPNPPKSRLMDGVQWIKATMEGTVKTKLWLTGHGSSTAGSTTAGLHETLIGKFVLGSAGAVVVSMSSGTTFTGGTASVPTTTSSGTGTAGSIVFGGALNDGKAGGQAAVIGSHTTTTLTLLTGFAVAPASGDVCRSSVVGYLPSTTTTMTSARLLCQSKGLQYLCHGCVPTAVSWGGLNTGEVPFVEVTWSVAWWEYSSATFPSSTTTEVFTPAPVAAGSFFMNAVGTATNATRNIRGFTLDHKIGTIQIAGPGSPSQYGKYVDAIRGPDSVTLTWIEDADATTTTPVMPGKALGSTAQHILYTLSTADGKAMAVYFPNVIFNSVPVQYNDGGINRLKITAMAYTGPTTTTELQASAMRWAWA